MGSPRHYVACSLKTPRTRFGNRKEIEMPTIGKTYRFTRQEGMGDPCPDFDGMNGALVTVIDTYDCLNCWLVKCLASGKELVVFGDELDEIPFENLSSDIQQFNIVIALIDQMPDVYEGCVYTVQHIDRDGRLMLSGDLRDVPGTYDPSNFRRL